MKELQITEAKRRLMMLGKTVKDDNGVLLKQRARSLGLSVAVLRQWHQCYRHGGLDALLPTTWQELPDSVWVLIEQRYAALEEMADKEIVTEEEIAALAALRGWSITQAKRWLRRYRSGGLYGLAPLHRPKKESACPDPGALSDVQLAELFRRCDLLGELAEHEHLSNADVAKRAEEVGVSSRTVRAYHSWYRRNGLKGLAPRGRTDKGKTHILSTSMVQMIEHLRLSHRDAPIRFVYELACTYAAEIGERAPSLWQVRSLCSRIPAPVRVLADGREETFRNSYRLTYPIRHEANRIVWQMDHKAPLHVLVRDLRAPSHRSLTGEVRPYLTLVIDSASRLVMSGLFSYDPRIASWLQPPFVQLCS